MSAGKIVHVVDTKEFFCEKPGSFNRSVSNIGSIQAFKWFGDFYIEDMGGHTSDRHIVQIAKRRRYVSFAVTVWRYCSCC
jgi:hypothetical protein